MGVQALPTGVQGPLPPGTVGLILGRSSTILRGIQVHPGIVDSDSQGEIKILISVAHGIVAIPEGERVAQLILLPGAPLETRSLRQERGDQGFGSSGPAVFWTAAMTDRPQLLLHIEDRPFRGILDTGADVSVLSDTFWPDAWPRETAPATLQGIGQARPQKSLKILKWRDNEGHSGYFQPYVLKNLPTNLWGRDLLKEMGVVLTTLPDATSNKASKMMQGWGWRPGKALGKRSQGEIQPVSATLQDTRTPGDGTGLGHFY